MLGGWFEGITGVLLILPYKYGVLKIGDDNRDPPNKYFGFESHEYLSLEMSWKSAPLIIGSVFVWHYIAIFNCGISCFVIERAIATLYSRDYESNPRRWISTLIPISYHITSITGCFIFCFHFIPLDFLLCVNALGTVFYVPFVFILRYINTSARDKLRHGKNITNHSLTAKFQIVENVRSMNVATHLTIIVGLYDVVFLIIIILATHQIANAEVFYEASEMIIVLNPIILVPGLISSVKEWREKFLEYIPISKLRIDPDHNPYVVENHSEIARTHFSQLETYWT